MSDTDESRGLGDRLWGVPTLGGLLTGALSFVLGYLSFLGIAAGTGDGIEFKGRSLRQVGLLFYNSIRVPTREQRVEKLEVEYENLSEPVIQENRLDVWYNPFYNADTIETQTRVFNDGKLDTETGRDISRATAESQGWFLPDVSFPDPVYMLIPPLILAGLGLVFAYRFISLDRAVKPTDILNRAVLGGVTITVGFLLLALLGTYVFVLEEIALFTRRTSPDTFTRPDRIQTLVYATLYPLICSSVGILAGQLLRRPDITTSETGARESSDPEKPETTDVTESSESEDGDSPETDESSEDDPDAGS